MADDKQIPKQHGLRLECQPAVQTKEHQPTRHGSWSPRQQCKADLHSVRLSLSFQESPHAADYRYTFQPVAASQLAVHQFL